MKEKKKVSRGRRAGYTESVPLLGCRVGHAPRATLGHTEVLLSWRSRLARGTLRVGSVGRGVIRTIIGTVFSDGAPATANARVHDTFTHKRKMVSLFETLLT